VIRIVRRRGIAALFPRSAGRARRQLAVWALAVGFTVAAAGSSLLALVNGPVGPSRWSPALLELRPLPGATLVRTPADFLADEHGRDFLVWELRGGEVCVEPDPGPGSDPPPPGIEQVLVGGDSAEPPFAGAGEGRDLGDYTLWDIAEPTPGDSGCPFIADGARADPAGDD